MTIAPQATQTRSSHDRWGSAQWRRAIGVVVNVALLMALRRPIWSTP